MDENKITNISTEYPPSDQAQAISWSQVLKFVRIATRELFEKAGGKITGDVNMDGNKILNLPTDYPPSDQAQALSWSQIAQFLRRSTINLANKTGETFRGDINMGGNKITNLPTYYLVTDNTQAVSWAQAVSLVRRYITNFVKKTGDTITGILTINGNLNVTGNIETNIGDDAIRTLGCTDLVGGKGFSLNLGTNTNQLQYEVTIPPRPKQPVKLLTTEGFLVQKDGNNICKFGDNLNIEHIVLYLHNNRPTWLVSCIFQISLGS